jgi:hypothetical protein
MSAFLLVGSLGWRRLTMNKNDLLTWRDEKIKEADKRFGYPHGKCLKCGSPLAMSYDTFGLHCRSCSWVMK